MSVNAPVGDAASASSPAALSSLSAPWFSGAPGVGASFPFAFGGGQMLMPLASSAASGNVLFDPALYQQALFSYHQAALMSTLAMLSGNVDGMPVLASSPLQAWKAPAMEGSAADFGVSATTIESTSDDAASFGQTRSVSHVAAVPVRSPCSEASAASSDDEEVEFGRRRRRSAPKPRSSSMRRAAARNRPRLAESELADRPGFAALQAYVAENDSELGLGTNVAKHRFWRWLRRCHAHVFAEGENSAAAERLAADVQLAAVVLDVARMRRFFDEKVMALAFSRSEAYACWHTLLRCSRYLLHVMDSPGSVLADVHSLPGVPLMGAVFSDLDELRKAVQYSHDYYKALGQGNLAMLTALDPKASLTALHQSASRSRADAVEQLSGADSADEQVEHSAPAAAAADTLVTARADSVNRLLVGAEGLDILSSASLATSRKRRLEGAEASESARPAKLMRLLA